MNSVVYDCNRKYLFDNPPLPFSVLASLQVHPERKPNPLLGMDLLLKEAIEDQEEETKHKHQGLLHTPETDVPENGVKNNVNTTPAPIQYEENVTIKGNTNEINNPLLNSRGGGNAQHLFSPTITHQNTSNLLFG